MPSPRADTISWSEFEMVDIRVGRVTRVEDFPEARKPAYRLWIDFGPLGERRSSAQLTDHYAKADLEGRHVLAVVNFPPKQIAGFMSEVLVLGLVPEDGRVVIVGPDRDVAPGTRLA